MMREFVYFVLSLYLPAVGFGLILSSSSGTWRHFLGVAAIWASGWFTALWARSNR